MGLYLFQHPETEEIKEVFQNMKDDHVYSENGIAWKRVFVNPQANICSTSKLDPDDSKGFVNLTGAKRGTLGNLQDLSQELSQKREKRYGRDKIKEKSWDSYKKETGKDHPDKRKEKLEKLKNTPIDLKIKL